MTDIPVGKEFWLDVLKQITRRTRGRADAEDLLHAAYLRLERYGAQNEVTNPAAFLVRAASNIGIDNYRRDKILSGGELPDGFDLQDNAPLQDEVVTARTRLKRVKEGLEHLTPRTREVFLMHRLEELKYHQIATRLGISQSAVEKHVAKAALFLTGWMEGW